MLLFRLNKENSILWNTLWCTSAQGNKRWLSDVTHSSIGSASSACTCAARRSQALTLCTRAAEWARIGLVKCSINPDYQYLLHLITSFTLPSCPGHQGPNLAYINRFIFKIELLIEYYSENFGIQVIFGDYTTFSIVLK